jgi:hypothetical protein
MYSAVPTTWPWAVWADAAEELRDAEVGELHVGGLAFRGWLNPGIAAVGGGPSATSRLAGLRSRCIDAMIVGHLERPRDGERHRDRLPPGKPSARPQQSARGSCRGTSSIAKYGCSSSSPNASSCTMPGCRRLLSVIDLGVEPLPQPGVIGQVGGEHFHATSLTGTSVSAS